MSNIISERSFAFQQVDKPVREYRITRGPGRPNSSEGHMDNFIIAEENKCKDMNTTGNLLVGVYTGINEASPREYIRKTWGLTARTNPRIRLIFVVGSSTDAEAMNKIKMESLGNGDIVQGDFIDTYRNLTLKSFIFFKWANLFCRNAKNLLKIDSDMQINLAQLLDVLELSTIQDKFICSIVVKHNKVIRDASSKWYVPFQYYSEFVYPNHCPGAAYIVPKRIGMKIAALPLPNEPFPVDDAYITGILREELQEDLTAGIFKFHHNRGKSVDMIFEGTNKKEIKSVRIMNFRH
ncbi:hypothetical protein FSP39_001809 [Pinctada imbricata]|uniref:Hexosyltransferase n=1 Tax=Pinctada imbricata TaxID=66713 RepID=A0AA89C5D3_PINIB|nr:hypothetical protein FSP39_001809 [Pinctada imbricata]